jgi:hypothetical protein
MPAPSPTLPFSTTPPRVSHCSALCQLPFPTPPPGLSRETSPQKTEIEGEQRQDGRSCGPGTFLEGILGLNQSAPEIVDQEDY